MAFRCFLDLPANEPAPDDGPELDYDLDDYDCLVMYACAQISRTNARFHLGGFGSDEWHTGITTELSCFMEQFPELMHSLAAGKEFQLDLYEQGLERRLIFSPRGDTIEIRCIPLYSSPAPDPDTEVMSFPDAEEMLANLGRDFVEAIRRVNPGLAEMGPFPQWLRGNFQREPAGMTKPSPGRPGARGAD